MGGKFLKLFIDKYLSEWEEDQKRFHIDHTNSTLFFKQKKCSIQVTLTLKRTQDSGEQTKVVLAHSQVGEEKT